MKSLARSVVFGMSFFELCDDDELDPDIALGALGDMARYLQACGPEERAALREVLTEFIRETETNKYIRTDEERQKRIKFYKGFMETFRLDDADD